jgi:hypothetical protein
MGAEAWISSGATYLDWMSARSAAVSGDDAYWEQKIAHGFQEKAPAASEAQCRSPAPAAPRVPSPWLKPPGPGPASGLALPRRRWGRKEGTPERAPDGARPCLTPLRWRSIREKAQVRESAMMTGLEACQWPGLHHPWLPSG